VNETPVIAVVDAGAGLGQPVAHRAMQMAIRKATEYGAGFVTIRNSNHFGIAGYYAMMALAHDCIGFALTNATPKVVPTFGKNATLGTNPIAVAAPAGKERAFVLDMATSGVSIGKLEIADQWDQPIPVGWAIDKDGKPYTDPHRAIEDFKRNLGGGLLPLGGEGELFSGYKGYGLALWVDIFSGVLAGAGFATSAFPPFGDQAPHANVGHFLGAWRVDCFRPVDEFKETMDRWRQLLRNAPMVEGQDRIYIPGEKEFIAAEQNLRDGIPLSAKVVHRLRQIANEWRIEYDLE
jgi:LDH2 family malate/lactate/ureidoglycolate dehydrogenase